MNLEDLVGIGRVSWFTWLGYRVWTEDEEPLRSTTRVSMQLFIRP